MQIFAKIHQMLQNPLKFLSVYIYIIVYIIKCIFCGFSHVILICKHFECCYGYWSHYCAFCNWVGPSWGHKIHYFLVQSGQKIMSQAQETAVNALVQSGTNGR